MRALPSANVRVRLEIGAEMPNGAPDNVVPTVSENCRTLKVISRGLEEEAGYRSKQATVAGAGRGGGGKPTLGLVSAPVASWSRRVVTSRLPCPRRGPPGAAAP
jgi:hypothetical protein